MPLLHEDRLLGGLTVSRRATGEFPPDVVALLTAFAAQSAIALQNARLFRELQAKSHELEVASRHKSQFLANMSHELRTPLNAILGYGELIVDGIYGEVPERMREVLERVDASGRHLLGLINDVLDLSKIEAGQLVLALADYSMKEIVETVIASLDALAVEKGLTLAFDLAPDLPTGRGDQRRLTQVLLNLVGNAIKFTEEGGVGVQVGVSGPAFEVSVRDTRTRDRAGRSSAHLRGIPAGRRVHHAAEGRHGPGSGDRPAHRGPARRPPVGGIDAGRRGDLPVLDPGARRAAGARLPERDLVSRRILVVDDHADNRRILRDLLGSAGFEILEALTGEEAVAKAEATVPDLILMDIQLPGIDGYEATRRIKANEALRRIPLIVVTSYALSGDDVKALAAGADAYVAKPFSPRAMLAKVREYLP